MEGLGVIIKGIVNRYVRNASPRGDDLPQTVRLDRRGEIFIENLWNGMQALAEEGSYYVSRTPTPGTGITLTSATGTTYSDTQGILSIYNSDTQATGANPGKRIILDMILFLITAASTGTTLWRLCHALDVGNRGSAGTLLSPGMNINMDTGNEDIAVVRGGVITIAASSNSVRKYWENAVRASVGAVGDIVCVKFGAQESPTAGGLISGTTGAAITVYAPPTVIGPNQCYVMNEFATGRSAAFSGEILVGYSVR